MNLKEVSRGIPHIEDLEISEFVNTLLKWHIHEATEKLDGAQILFGIDENGFYTSRETKGGKRIYNESDYDVRFPTTYKRAVHKLLESVSSNLRAAGMRPGDQVEAEVLYGLLPNVVPYSEDINYLIFLRATEGKVNIDRLKQELNGKSLLIPLETPYTVDGRTIQIHEQTHEWHFGRSPKLPVDSTIAKEFNPLLIKLIEFMRLTAYKGLSNNLLSATPLNRIPDWCDPKDWKTVKEELKANRAGVLEEFYRRKLEIKEVLLDHYVRRQASAFGPSVADGGWIEGVVLRRLDTGKMVKIVDKDVFGVVREQAWEERNKLTEAAKSTSGDHSFLGSLYLDLATSIGHPELGTMQAKHYLRKAGMITEERLENLAEGIDVDAVKDYWYGLLAHKTNQLEARLDKYEEETRTNSNRSVRRTSEHTAIEQRTLETFSNIFGVIQSLQESATKAQTAEELVNILVGKKLGEI